MIKNIHKIMYSIGCFIVFLYASQCCASAAESASGAACMITADACNTEEMMLEAAKALKRQIDRSWRRVDYIEHLVHDTYSQQVCEMLYGRKQYQEQIIGGIYPISYSFMVEREDGVRISEFLVNHVLNWTYRAPQRTAAVLNALSRQAVEDRCEPYLKHILAHPLYPKDQLPQLQTLASCAECEGINALLDEHLAKHNCV